MCPLYGQIRCHLSTRTLMVTDHYFLFQSRNLKRTRRTMWMCLCVCLHVSDYTSRRESKQDVPLRQQRLYFSSGVVMKWNVSNVREQGERRPEWEGVSSVRVELSEALMWELSCSEQGFGHREKDSTWQVQSMADSGHGCMQWGKWMVCLREFEVVYVAVCWIGAYKCSHSHCTCILMHLCIHAHAFYITRIGMQSIGVHWNWLSGSLLY